MPASTGGSIDFSAFKGKKVLFVNVASGSGQQLQLRQLDSLAVQFSNKLVVIAVPSNDFGKEPLEDVAIHQYMQTQGCTHVLLAAKTVLSGAGATEVYRWIGNKDLNGRASFPITTDFQKILIDEDGMLIGHFSIEVSPFSELIKSML